MNDFCLSGNWAMRPDALLEIRSAMAAASPDSRGIRWAAGGRASVGAKVAVVPIYGVIDKRGSLMMDIIGGTSTDAVSATMAELASDPSIKGIILDVDSPGGTVTGTPVLAQQIFDMRDRKPIVAVANSEMNSAAYWIGSAAHRVFVSPDARIGNVGVWSAAADQSEMYAKAGVKVQVWRSEGSPHKAEFSGYEPFSKEAIAHEQEIVDQLFSDFASAVARHRGTSVNNVRDSYGKGRSLNARDSVAAGMSDGIATLGMVVGRMQSGRLTMGVLNDGKALAAEMELGNAAINRDARLRFEMRRKGVI